MSSPRSRRKAKTPKVDINNPAVARLRTGGGDSPARRSPYRTDSMESLTSAYEDASSVPPTPSGMTRILKERVNPFVYDTAQLTAYEKFKIAVMFPIMLVRIAVILVSLVVLWVFCKASVLGLAKPRSRSQPDGDDENEVSEVPLAAWRRALQWPCPWFARLLLLAFGYYWIPITHRPGSLAGPTPYAGGPVSVITAAPHSNLIDAILFYYTSFPAVVSMAANGRVPIMGDIMKATQAILVDRKDPNSRHKCLETIRSRALTDGFPPTLIFPEGLCTNRRCLIQFKRGAFTPGVPVAPVAIKYSYSHFNPSQVTTAPGTGMWFLRMLTQVVNHVEMVFLPIHKPTAAEKADSILFANNVRNELAAELGLTVTEHSYEDVRLAEAARKLHLPPEEGPVEFGVVHKLYDLTFDDANALMNQFAELREGEERVITLEDFAEHLNLPLTPDVAHAFSLLDRDGNGAIEWKEFVLGMMFLSKHMQGEDAVDIMFQTFDQTGSGQIDVTAFESVVRAGFPLITKTEVDAIFREVDADESGFIDADEFKTFAKSHPIYVQIFMDWRERNPAAPASGGGGGGAGGDDGDESEAGYGTPTGGAEGAAM